MNGDFEYVVLICNILFLFSLQYKYLTINVVSWNHASSSIIMSNVLNKIKVGIAIFISLSNTKN